MRFLWFSAKRNTDQDSNSLSVDWVQGRVDEVRSRQALATTTALDCDSLRGATPPLFNKDIKRIASTHEHPEHRIIRMLPSAGFALLLLFPTLLVAEDDQQPIPKVGSCPVGYRTSGNYCIPLQNTDQEVIIKLKSCPPGYRTSGNYCIKS